MKTHNKNKNVSVPSEQITDSVDCIQGIKEEIKEELLDNDEVPNIIDVKVEIIEGDTLENGSFSFKEEPAQNDNVYQAVNIKEETDDYPSDE